jgi:peptide/nickel transport system permease protein
MVDPAAPDAPAAAPPNTLAARGPVPAALAGSAPGTASARSRRGNSRLRARAAVLLRDGGTKFGLGVLIAVGLMALFAPWIAPYDPAAQSILQTFQPPSAAHWFGTDEYGRDVLSRVIWGARPALIVGLLSVLVSMLVGMPLGMFAGLAGGRVDLAVSAIVDVMMSFPSLLLSLMIVTLVGPGLYVLVVAIGLAHVPLFIRLARSATMQLRELDYVAASRSFGGGNGWIVVQHILPNIIGPLTVMATLCVAGAIRDEAALSFLGLGIQPPTPSWGNIIRDGVGAILAAPWMALISGFALALTVLAVNMIGDSVRDVLDPRDIAAATVEKGERR